MDYQIFLSAAALSDLSIGAWGSCTDEDPEAGARKANGLLDQVASLSCRPERGRRVPEFHWLDLREIHHRSSRIVYRVNLADKSIEIVRCLPHVAKPPLPEIPSPSEDSLS